MPESISIHVDPAIYSVEIVRRAAHRFTGTHIVRIQTDSSYIVVKFVDRPGTSYQQPIESEFQTALLDEIIRAEVLEESRPVRDALIEMAIQSALKKPHTGP